MEIKYYEDKYLNSLNELLLSTFQVTKKYSNDSNNDIELIMIDEDKVVGYLSLNKCVDLLSGSNYFYVNYVCVREEYRQQGIASSLFEKVFDICRELDVSYLELTSNPSRVAAHKLYERLGFSVRETTVFRKVLE